MKKLLFSLIAFSFFFYANAQSSKSILLHLIQSPNNYQYHEIFNVPITPDEIIISPLTDQYGISYQHQTKRGYVFQALLAGRHINTYSQKVSPKTNEESRYSYEIDGSDFHIRLEAGKQWKIPNHSPLRIGLGLSLDPRITHKQFSTTRSDLFPSKYTSYEASVFFIPQFSYQISDRFIVDFKLPIELSNYHLIDGESKNPNLTPPQNKVNTDKIYIGLLNRTYTFSVGYFIYHEDRNAKQQNLTSFL